MYENVPTTGTGYEGIVHIMFSFVVPIYNTGKWLHSCLESIRRQSNSCWEAILVDDGSTDGDGEKCDEFAASDDRFKVIHQTNNGVSFARNHGIHIANGDWIWCVDSDDVIHPKALDVYRNILASNPECEIACHDFLTGKSISFPPILLENVSSCVVPLHSYIEMSAWRCIFQSKFAGSVSFYPLRVGEDILFCIGLLLKAQGTVLHVALPLYGYIDRDTSVMHHPCVEQTKDSILWMSQALTLYAQDKRQLFTAAEKIRWNAFLGILSSRIVQYSKRDRRKLQKSWFENLASLSTIHLPCLEKYLINFLLFLYRISRKTAFAVHGCLGRGYGFLLARRHGIMK